MYYVYELVDPRNGKVFYVGKGSKSRATDHQRYVVTENKEYKEQNPKRFNKIASILRCGLSVEVRIVQRFDNEDEAYTFEEQRVEHYGLANLCNLMKGGKAGPVLFGEKNPMFGKQRPDYSNILKQRNSENNPAKRPEVREKMRNSWNADRRKRFGHEVSERMRGQSNPAHQSGVRQKMSERMRTHHPSAKITADQVREIRRKHLEENISQQDLAVEYGLSKSAVCNIINRKRWGHVQ